MYGCILLLNLEEDVSALGTTDKWRKVRFESFTLNSIKQRGAMYQAGEEHLQCTCVGLNSLAFHQNSGFMGYINILHWPGEHAWVRNQSVSVRYVGGGSIPRPRFK
jgi:hypothetical protein